MVHTVFPTLLKKTLQRWLKSLRLCNSLPRNYKSTDCKNRKKNKSEETPPASLTRGISVQREAELLLLFPFGWNSCYCEAQCGVGREAAPNGTLCIPSSWKYKIYIVFSTLLQKRGFSTSTNCCPEIINPGRPHLAASRACRR